MNKLKKLSIVLIIIMLFGCIFINKTYATLSCNINLNASKTDLVQGEEFSVYVKISNLQTEKGIIAIGAVLEYDTSLLTLIDIEGQNKWSEPFYNASSGKITSFKNALSKNNENVLKINFKAKDNITGNAFIKIKDFEISDGDTESNVGEDSITVNISLQNNNPQEDNDQKAEETKPNNTSQNNQTSTNTNVNTSNAGTASKPSGTTNKGNTSNTHIENSEANTVENILESDAETNIIQNDIAENEEQNNDVQNIFEQEEQEETSNKTPDSKKKLVYLACIFGAIAIVIITFYIIKYLKILKKQQ